MLLVSSVIQRELIDIMINKGLFTSKTCEWETPKKIFEELNAEFNFTLDVCATKDNKKCNKYFSINENGLKQEWGIQEICFMNPPYGKEISLWIKKAFESSKRGTKVVCLLPARTDTKWFHDFCLKGTIRFIKGRLKFGNSKFNAPFPSMIVIF